MFNFYNKVSETVLNHQLTTFWMLENKTEWQHLQTVQTDRTVQSRDLISDSTTALEI